MLPALGPPAALLPGIVYEQRTIALHPGDVGVLVSDGVTEGLGDAGAAALQQLVSRVAAAGPSAAIICRLVMNDASLGRGPAGVGDWQDDLTVVVFAVPTRPEMEPAPVEARANAAPLLAQPVGVDK